MKKLELLIMPIVAISLLASCGNNNKKVTITKCNLDGAVSLFAPSDEDGPKLAFNASYKNNDDSNILFKRTIDSVMPATMLDPNGNEVKYTVGSTFYLDENYVLICGATGEPGNYLSKNIILNINNGEVSEIPDYTHILWYQLNYVEAPFAKNLYQDENGNMYLLSEGEERGAKDEVGIYLYDNKTFNTIKKYLIPDGYELDRKFFDSPFVVNSNQEIVLPVYKFLSETNKKIDAKLLYFDKDGNSKLVELPYDTSTPDLINQNLGEGDKIFIGLDNKFYFAQSAFTNWSNDSTQVRPAALYQIDFSKANKNEIYTKLWEQQLADVDFIPDHLYSFDNKQTISFNYSSNGSFIVTLTLDFDNPSGISPVINNLKKGDKYYVYSSFQDGNFMYAKGRKLIGDDNYIYYLIKYDLTNLEKDPVDVLTFPEGISIGKSAISKDGRNFIGVCSKWLGGSGPDDFINYSYLCDTSKSGVEIDLKEITSQVSSGFIPL